MTSALDPCPHCGGSNVGIIPIRDGYRVQCHECFCAGPCEFHGPLDQPSSRDRAISGWNHRALTIGETTAALFHNAIRILCNLGEQDLRGAGVIDENWGTPEASKRDQIGAFFADPYTEAIRMPDANFQRLWALIVSRQPKRNTA